MAQFTPLDFFVLDTETTGFVPKIHRVIEFACATLSGEKVTEEYDQLLSFGGEIPPHVQVLTSIKPQDLDGKPTFADILPIIQSKLTPKTIIVGQNIGFDIRMLKGEGLDLSDYPSIDTAMLASIVFPELESYSLSYVSTILDLTHEPKHRALGDVHATTELLQRCLARLQELDGKAMGAIHALAKRAPDGYQRLFLSLEGKGKAKPAWLKQAHTPITMGKISPLTGIGSEPGVVTLVEEPLSSSFLSRVVAGSVNNKKRTWIGVKNLDATLRRIEIPSGVTVLYAPEYILNPDAEQQFLTQEQFTADELTLAIKLALYPACVRADMPLHGDEQAIWNGKLASLRTDKAYRSQFEECSDTVRILDHQELLRLVAEPQSPITKGDNVIIDDASMLEDTATYAYGWNCPISSLRAAAEGNSALTKCVDLLELWIEKVRGGTDIRYLVGADLGSKEADGLLSSIDAALVSSPSPQAQQALEHLKLILDPNNLPGRIAWTEVFQDGSRHLKSVPEDIASVLDQRLYISCATTLLVPPGGVSLAAVIPPARKCVTIESDDGAPIPIDFPDGVSIPAFLKSAEGKSVVLANSKRTIEDLYVRNFHDLENAGFTLICQGFCGGHNRMQAEFAAAKAPAALVVTPWMYETFELPENSVDKLVIQALPFDHPNHAVIGRRCERYRDPFNEYSLPRLMHRVFRLLRTFSRHRTDISSIDILDDRLKTKSYGRTVIAFLKLFSSGEAASVPAASKTKKDPGQMKLL